VAVFASTRVGWLCLEGKIPNDQDGSLEWHQTHTQNIPTKISTVTGRIATLDAKGEVSTLGEDEVEELHSLSDELRSLSRIHSSITWQQSRVNWLREGDANSKKFHGIISERRRVNIIYVLHVGSVLVEGVANVREAVFNHFLNHFQSDVVVRPRPVDLNFCMLSYREGEALVKPFSMEELKAAVLDCDSFKCPGPYGVKFGFIKDFWEDLKADLLHFVSDFHPNGKLLKGINISITLIPKKDCPPSLNDYRHISLVGSLYKVLAKLLANRLWGVIGTVISDTQSAFVKGRQILDGIVVANEVVDETKKLNKNLLMFKVDFENANDSVNWNYLDDIMCKISFPTLWRKWMKECVTTATATVLVNGSPTDEFPLAWGLRQGLLLF